jgi:hypothetical protein
VLVPVSPERKAVPFRVLSDARIAVEDFQIISVEKAAEMAAHAQETKS